MRKRLIIIILAVLAVLCVCTACSSKTYKIIVVSGEDNIDTIPEKAEEGETVTILTMSVTDAVMRCAVDGEAIKEVKDSQFEFVMPAHDVEVKVWVDTSGFPGA